MKIWLLVAFFSLLFGYIFVAFAYKNAFSRGKTDKQIEIYFDLGSALLLIGFISLSVAWYNIGVISAKEETKKETIFVIQKKLDNHRMEILALDEDVRFEIKKDGVYIIPIFKQNISLSDVKEIVK